MVCHQNLVCAQGHVLPNTQAEADENQICQSSRQKSGCVMAKRHGIRPQVLSSASKEQTCWQTVAQPGPAAHLPESNTALECMRTWASHAGEALSSSL